MSIADDLMRAYDDGYEQGKSDAEAYILHCGDVTPQTNADRIRSLPDNDLAWQFARTQILAFKHGKTILTEKEIYQYWLDWLKQEIDEEIGSV